MKKTVLVNCSNCISKTMKPAEKKIIPILLCKLLVLWGFPMVNKALESMLSDEIR